MIDIHRDIHSKQFRKELRNYIEKRKPPELKDKIIVKPMTKYGMADDGVWLKFNIVYKYTAHNCDQESLLTYLISPTRHLRVHGGFHMQMYYLERAIMNWLS